MRSGFANVLAITVLAIANFAHASIAVAADNFRAATFNINWGNIDLPEIERVIKAANADIVCLQETTPVAERFLRRKLLSTYSHMYFKGFRGKFAAERFGFLSKTPLNAIQYEPPSKGLFGTYFATVTHHNRDIRIVNVHLNPFLIPKGSGFRQAFHAISKVEDIHKREIAAICAKFDPSQPTLVCGDFNSLSMLSAPTHLKSLGLTDSFESVTRTADSNPTWQWPVGRTHLRFRIDYVFHSNHFKTKASKILKTKASDHFLVMSELKLRILDETH